MKDRTATLRVDSRACRLEDLVQAAEGQGYSATVRSIVPHDAAPAAGVSTGN